MKGQRERASASPVVDEEMLTASEAAALLSVSPKTLARWARDGGIRFMVTLGGHRRFRRADVMVLRTRLRAGLEES